MWIKVIDYTCIRQKKNESTIQILNIVLYTESTALYYSHVTEKLRKTSLFCLELLYNANMYAY